MHAQMTAFSTELTMLLCPSVQYATHQGSRKDQNVPASEFRSWYRAGGPLHGFGRGRIDLSLGLIADGDNPDKNIPM